MLKCLYCNSVAFVSYHFDTYLFYNTNVEVDIETLLLINRAGIWYNLQPWTARCSLHSAACEQIELSLAGGRDYSFSTQYMSMNVAAYYSQEAWDMNIRLRTL